MSGIRTLDDIRDRCVVDDETGCWHWRGAMSGDYPCLWLPVADNRVTLGRAIGWLKTGVKPPANTVWHVTCATKNCANPEHRKPGSRRSQMLAAGLKRSVVQRLRISRNRAHKLDESKASAIRASAEPLRVVAARYGVSMTTCSRIRRGEMWREAGCSAFSTWARAA